MSIQACAEIVRKGDPDRFLAIMAAPPDVRGAMFAVFAFNVEVARTPWVSAEPMINEIRLQWWRDALAEIEQGGVVRRHEVVTPLSKVIDATSAGILGELVEARKWDVQPDAFEDVAHFDRYIDKTSAGLMWVAARAIDVQKGEAAIRDYGYASGLANWFMAIPELEGRGRVPLVDGRPEAVKKLALAGLKRLTKSRKLVPRNAYYATRTGWQADRTLRSAAANPAAVKGGRLHNSEFRRRSSLLFRVLLRAP